MNIFIRPSDENLGTEILELKNDLLFLSNVQFQKVYLLKNNIYPVF